MRLMTLLVVSLAGVVGAAPVAATDAGSLQKAQIRVLDFAYSTDHTIEHLTLSGDGTTVGLEYHWYDEGHHTRIAVSPVGGGAERTLLQFEGEAWGLALDGDATEMAVAHADGDGYGWIYMDLVAGTYQVFTPLSGFMGLPEMSFEDGTFTTCRRSSHLSRFTYHLETYDLRSGALLSRVSGDEGGITCETPSRMADGRLLFNGTDDGQFGAYLVDPSTGTLEGATRLMEPLESHSADVGHGSLVQASCDDLLYYQPLESEPRTIFTDDSGYGPNTDCAVHYVEMGIDSQYTFTADAHGEHVVQVFGEGGFPQSGRYFTPQDVTGDTTDVDRITPAHAGASNRERKVSDDGTRILLQADHKWGEAPRRFMVVEVQGTEGNACAAEFAATEEYGFLLYLPFVEFAAGGQTTYYEALLLYQHEQGADYFALLDVKPVAAPTEAGCAPAVLDTAFTVTIPRVEVSLPGQPALAFRAVLNYLEQGVFALGELTAQ